MERPLPRLPAEARAARSAPAALPTRRSYALAACLIATFMAAVENTIVATAMPTIVADLGGFQLFSWVFAAYLLTQGVSIPIYGRLADIFGRKRVFIAGAALFLLGSTLCGFAWGMVPLILFRALQGLGAGAVQPIAYTIAGDLYTPAERARVQGLLSGTFGVAAVIGPALGAFLVEHVSWSVVFWINLPIGVAAMAMIALFLNERLEHHRRQIDYLGALLLMLGAGSLMLALVQGVSLDAAVLAGALGIGLAALAALAYYERRVTEPMLPLRLWRNRIIVVGSFGGFTMGAITMAVAAFLPTYVQAVMGLSATAAGFTLGAMSVSWALASFAAGRVMVRTSYRLTAVVGALGLILGTAALIMLTPQRGLLWAGAGSLLVGIGMGFCNTTYIVSVQASVSWQERGVATSANMFMRMVGQALGTALFGAVLNLGLARAVPGMADAVNRLLDPVERQGLDPQLIRRLSAAIAGSLHEVYLIAGALALVTLALGLSLPPLLSPLRKAPEG
ncbi:MAG TPA: MDR family MFS transporter [Alphaproteobacteria bacterium]|nr:MDR family MFS transporter [Alphaproteobacteria bacterium]